MDYRLSLMSGIDIPIPECKLILHQPTIKEISYIGEVNFFTGAQCLCINKSMYQGHDIKSNFSLLMMLMSDETTKDKKESVRQVLTLIFPNYKIFITPIIQVFRHFGRFLKDCVGLKKKPLDEFKVKGNGLNAAHILFFIFGMFLMILT